MINDISAGNLDDQMLMTVGKYVVPYIAMHMQGTPRLQDQPQHQDPFAEISFSFLKYKLAMQQVSTMSSWIQVLALGKSEQLPHPTTP